MAIKLGMVMDPIESITTYKDSTFAMLLEAQQRDYEIHYMQQEDLFLKNGKLFLSTTHLTVKDDPKDWFELGSQQIIAAKELGVLMMRKDPPLDVNYLNTTLLLDHAEAEGVLVVNKPQAIRDANEKLYTAWFPQCCAPFVVSSEKHTLKAFINEQQDVIVKPLDSMGGDSIFRVKQDDPNLNVILENLTRFGLRKIIAQQYIQEISQGDKRILIINGEVMPYALARLAAPGETRANLATGGTGRVQPLSERDRWIATQVGPTLKAKGLMFVGIDVIGDYLTEVNVTSPTCIREIQGETGINITGKLFDAIEEKLS